MHARVVIEKTLKESTHSYHEEHMSSIEPKALAVYLYNAGESQQPRPGKALAF
jgi:hypothetical protein